MEKGQAEYICWCGKYTFPNGKKVNIPSDIEIGVDRALYPHSDYGKKIINSLTEEQRAALIDYVEDQNDMYLLNLRHGEGRVIQGPPLPC